MGVQDGATLRTRRRDCGSAPVPAQTERSGFQVNDRHFGNFVRVAASRPEGSEITLLVAWNLKA